MLPRDPRRDAQSFFGVLRRESSGGRANVFAKSFAEELLVKSAEVRRLPKLHDRAATSRAHAQLLVPLLAEEEPANVVALPAGRRSATDEVRVVGANGG